MNKAAISRKRKAAPEERREAILNAALDEFVARGFMAARLEDIARNAGVAKGTIYLYFKDKEELFHELIRTALVPLVGQMDPSLAQARGGREMLEMFVHLFVENVANGRRGDLVRLVIAEGGRFPSIAEFYFREVIVRGLAGVTAILQRGVASGEIRNKAYAQFPQLVVAPAMLSLIWLKLFNAYSPLDVKAMLKAHLDIIFDGGRS